MCYTWVCVSMCVGRGATCGDRSERVAGWGPKASYKASNSSILCLVLPCLICRRVLYLSRPARTFSLWRRSFWVFLVSSRAWASSEVKAWGRRRRRDMTWDTTLNDSVSAHSYFGCFALWRFSYQHQLWKIWSGSLGEVLDLKKHQIWEPITKGPRSKCKSKLRLGAFSPNLFSRNKLRRLFIDWDSFESRSDSPQDIFCICGFSRAPVKSICWLGYSICSCVILQLPCHENQHKELMMSTRTHHQKWECEKKKLKAGLSCLFVCSIH